MTDYALFFVLWKLVSEDVKNYPLVEIALDYAKIGLALLLIISGMIHGIISTWSQIRLDRKLSREEKE